MTDLNRNPIENGAFHQRNGSPARLRVTIEGYRGAGKTLLTGLILAALSDNDSARANHFNSVNGLHRIVFDEITVEGEEV